MTIPLRVRMTAWYAAVLTLIVSGLATFVVLRLRADLTHAVDRTLVPAARQIAQAYAREGPRELQDTATNALSGEHVAAQALDPHGGVLVAWGDPVARGAMTPTAVPSIGSGLGGPSTARRPGGQPFRVVTVPVVRRGRPQRVVAAISLAPVDRSVHRVIVLLLLAGPPALAATAAGGWWLARRSLRPVERITRAAESIGADRLGERVEEPRTSDEMAHLARTFNLMLDRVERGVEGQRRLIADASHELRSPLAAMRAELDVSLRVDDLSPGAADVLHSARDEVDRLGEMVDDLLTIATIDEGGLVLASEALDLRAVAAEVVAALKPLADRRGVRLAVSGDPALVYGDVERLRHVLGNLVDNGIRFSPPAGTVGVTTSTEGDRTRMSVADEGVGIALEHRDQVFERFFRVDAARGRLAGAGLGLAIVRDVVRAHGGEVSVRPGEPRGSVFVIDLPRLRDEPDTRTAGSGEGSARSASRSPVGDPARTS